MQYLLRDKIVGFIFLMLLVSSKGSAQLRMSLNQEDHDDKGIHFGIHLGVNRSHFSFTHHPNFLYINNTLNDSIMVVESLNSNGINLAWLVNFRLGNHFDLRTFPLNLVFTEKVFRYNLKYPDEPAGEELVTDKKVQSISLQFPVQIKFSSDRIKNFKVYMMAGGRFEYDLAANAGARKAEDLLKLKPYDFGVDAGLGFHFYFPFFVLTPEFKFGWGLNDLHSRDENLKYSNVIDQINSRTFTFSLTVE